MVGRHELTDAAWARIETLLPATGGRGGRWRDHRQVINAILWQAKTGVPWRDLPERYGPWKTAHESRLLPRPARPRLRRALAPRRSPGQPLVLQRQLWRRLSVGSVVGGAGLCLASSAPPGPVCGVVQVGPWRTDECFEQAPELGHGQRDEPVGSGCGAPFPR